MTNYSKTALENMIVQKRAREAENYEKWSNNSNYFNTTMVEAAHAKKWTSDKTYNSRFFEKIFWKIFTSVASFAAQNLLTTPANHLSTRRAKLRTLLEEETIREKV